MQSEASFQLIHNGSDESSVHWAARTGLEHGLSLRKLENLYDRALPYLKAWSYNLTTKYGWIDEGIDNIGDMPVAVCLGHEEVLPANDEEFSLPHVSRLVLPRHFKHLIDPTLAHDWATMFANLMTPSTTPTTADILPLGRAGIPRPIQNIIHLLQLLSPGLLVLRSFEDDEGEWDSQEIDRGLPPSLWVGLHIEDLEDIFGATTAVSFYQAAEDPYCSLEEASSSGSSAYDSFDSFSDSSSASHSEEDWASTWGDVDEEDDPILLQFDKANLEIAHTFGKPQPSSDKYTIPQITTYDAPFESTMMMEEYRHCDSDCAFCGRCDDRFAQQLTERLLLTGVAV